MAFRLRRALSLSYPLLHRSIPRSKPISSRLLSTPIFITSTAAAVIPSSNQLTRPFTSTSTLFIKSFNPDTDEIGPDTILFEGCDYNHWLITMDFPKDSEITREQMIETYVNTAAQVFGSVEEAKKKIYALSTTTFQGFQVECSEETSEKFKSLPGVVFVLPDSYIDPINKEYGGDKYVNGEIFPRPPPVHYGRRDNRDRRRRDNYGPPNQQNYGPPNQQNYGPPNQQNYGPPNQQNYGPGQQQNIGPPQPQNNVSPPRQDSGVRLNRQNFDPSPPRQDVSPSPRQGFISPPRQEFSPTTRQNYTPSPRQDYAPPPQQANYGQSPPQQNYRPPPQQNYGNHPNSPPQQIYGNHLNSPPQQNYGNHPNSPPQQNYGNHLNSPPQQNYGNHPNSPPQQNYVPQGSGDRRSSYQGNLDSGSPYIEERMPWPAPQSGFSPDSATGSPRGAVSEQASGDQLEFPSIRNNN